MKKIDEIQKAARYLEQGRGARRGAASHARCGATSHARCGTARKAVNDSARRAVGGAAQRAVGSAAQRAVGGAAQRAVGGSAQRAMRGAGAAQRAVRDAVRELFAARCSERGTAQRQLCGVCWILNGVWGFRQLSLGAQLFGVGREFVVSSFVCILAIPTLERHKHHKQTLGFLLLGCELGFMVSG